MGKGLVSRSRITSLSDPFCSGASPIFSPGLDLTWRVIRRLKGIQTVALMSLQQSFTVVAGSEKEKSRGC